MCSRVIDSELASQFVQDFVGHSVITLADASIPGGIRREQAKELEPVRPHCPQQVAETRDFRLVNTFKLVSRFVFDPLVRQYSCSMNDSTNRSEFALQLQQQRPNRGMIANVDRMVADRDPGFSQSSQCHGDFAAGEYLSIIRLDDFWQSPPRQAGDQTLLDFRLTRQLLQPLRLFWREWTASEDHQP